MGRPNVDPARTRSQRGGRGGRMPHLAWVSADRRYEARVHRIDLLRILQDQFEVSCLGPQQKSPARHLRHRVLRAC